MYYGIDADDESERNASGAAFEDNYSDLESIFQGTPYVLDYIDSTAYGDLITAYQPLVDSEGNVVGILGSDFDASNIISTLNTTVVRVAQISIVCLIMAILLLTFIINRFMKNLNAVNGKIFDLVHN
ncbi:MAG: hypothetical protein PHP50_02325 [Lachnospiraceae bacterium]|nr:hypothetical protein [Lachnospiraceae bacterium]